MRTWGPRGGRMKAIREQVSFKVTARAERLGRAERERILANPGFGSVFSEHLVHATWDKANGWHDHELRPYGSIQLDPGALVFHYSQSVFEGLKAFHQDDGGVAAFRADAHAARFRRSARRLALPELPESTFIQAIDRLPGIDPAWVPPAAE